MYGEILKHFQVLYLYRLSTRMENAMVAKRNCIRKPKLSVKLHSSEDVEFAVLFV